MVRAMWSIVVAAALRGAAGERRSLTNETLAAQGRGLRRAPGFGLRETPVVVPDPDHPYGASWLSTIAHLLDVAQKIGDPWEHQSNLEGGTFHFTSNSRAPCSPPHKGDPHARDVLDFAAVHLGMLHTLSGTSSGHVEDVDALARFFGDRAAREARRETAADAASRAASVALVSLCVKCSSRGHRKSANGQELELAYVRAAVASLRTTCGAVVAGVMRGAAAGETRRAKALGFDGVFVVDHRDEEDRPAAHAGHWFTPPHRHPVQTWLRFANALRDLRARGEGDGAAVRWFRDRGPRTRAFEYVLWGEQDQALLQRGSNAALVAAADDACGAAIGYAVPYRALAWPASPWPESPKLAPARVFASGADLLDNVSCCVPGDAAGRSFETRYETVPLADVRAGALRGADGKGVDFALAAGVNEFVRPNFPAQPCVPRRRGAGAARGRLYDDCAYAGSGA